MLVLSRKLGESVVIGDDIQVKVVKCQNAAIKLGIDAPPHIQVDRLGVRLWDVSNEKGIPDGRQQSVLNRQLALTGYASGAIIPSFGIA